MQRIGRTGAGLNQPQQRVLTTCGRKNKSKSVYLNLLSLPGFRTLLIRLYVALGLVLTAGVLHAGIREPSSSIDSFLFMVKDDGQARPVVGAESLEMVTVLLDNREKKTIKMSGAALIPKELPPSGRVTILEVEALTGPKRQGYSYWMDTSIKLDLVSDTDLQDSYVVVFFWAPDNPVEPADITFCPIGDLEAGKVAKKTIMFPNVRRLEGWRYMYYIYCNGFPVEMHQIGDVAEVSGSEGLMIPWERRMDHYLEQARETKRSNKPRPFRIHLSNLDVGSCRERGIQQIRVLIDIRKDGTVEIIEPDPRLTAEEKSQLEKDAEIWNIFPALEEGKPVEYRVKIPLKL